VKASVKHFGGNQPVWAEYVNPDNSNLV